MAMKKPVFRSRYGDLGHRAMHNYLSDSPGSCVTPDMGFSTISKAKTQSAPSVSSYHDRELSASAPATDSPPISIPTIPNSSPPPSTPIPDDEPI